MNLSLNLHILCPISIFCEFLAFQALIYSKVSCCATVQKWKMSASFLERILTKEEIITKTRRSFCGKSISLL